MGLIHPPHLLLPVARAVSQLDDPVFRGVLLKSIGWSVAGFAILHIESVWIVHRVLELHGWLAWSADIVGSIATSLLALWLLLPVAAAIGTMYLDRVAMSVERRFYPWIAPPRGASFLEQACDGAAVALRVGLMNILALVLTLMLPGIGLILGWMIAAYDRTWTVRWSRNAKDVAQNGRIAVSCESRLHSGARCDSGAGSIHTATESISPGHWSGINGPCPGLGPYRGNAIVP